jgi:hypothetical protein
MCSIRSESAFQGLCVSLFLLLRYSIPGRHVARSFDGGVDMSSVRCLCMMAVVSIGIVFAENADAAAVTVNSPAYLAQGFTDHPMGTVETCEWISSDARSMLTEVGPYPNHGATRDLNPATGEWEAGVPIVIPSSPSSWSPSWRSADGSVLYNNANGISRSTLVGGDWDAGEVVPGVNDLQPTQDPWFTGSQLYYTAAVSYKWQLMVADYNPTTTGFDNARQASSIDDPQWQSFDPWVSADGRVLVFQSDRPGGYGGLDLWCAQWDDTTSQWSDITNLGPNVNTVDNELKGNIAEAAGLLFFARHPVDAGDSTPYVLMQARVPEPSSLILLGAGIMILVAYAWRRWKQTA